MRSALRSHLTIPGTAPCVSNRLTTNTCKPLLMQELRALCALPLLSSCCSGKAYATSLPQAIFHAKPPLELSPDVSEFSFTAFLIFRCALTQTLFSFCCWRPSQLFR